jgi:hypothetical protein
MNIKIHKKITTFSFNLSKNTKDHHTLTNASYIAFSAAITYCDLDKEMRLIIFIAIEKNIFKLRKLISH